MSDESSEAVQFATVDEVKSLDERVTALEGAPGAAPVPTNPGELLTPTPTNPELTPDNPGVEPGSVPAPSAGDNAPATTDPEGDTSAQNAPQPPAPEPGGANVTTNPGTSTDSGQGQSQVETPDPEGATSSNQGEPQPTQPAADASEKPLYVYVGENPTYSWPAGYVPTDLVTPDGKPLYHWTDDVDGAEASGAVDGTIGIYADEVQVPTPAS